MQRSKRDEGENKTEMPVPQNPWKEDPFYPMSDWQYEVVNGDTLRGYWEWVECRKQEERDQDAKV